MIRLVDAAETDVDRFVIATTSGRRDRAERMLEARPEIARGRWAALVLGHGWDGGPNEVGGPRAWPPLHYASHSVYAPVELVRTLLRRGADPNAYYANDYGPMSALCGAAGVLHDPELTQVLLDGGADPNGEPHFGDALYHSTEAQDPTCLRLLLEHGAQPNGTNALAHALDYPHIEHVRLLLDAGADPNEGALVAHAVRRGRGPDYIRLLAERGADVNRPGGETWRGNVPLRSPYEHAVLRGRDDVAAALEELGGRTMPLLGQEIDVADDPDAQEAIILGVLGLGVVGGRLDPADVGVDFRGVVGGSPSGTLLHHAAWVGDAELVRRLLAAGADATAPSDAPFSTPGAWAALGSEAWRISGRDYVAVMEALVSAGAELESRFLKVAHGPLESWLAERI